MYDIDYEINKYIDEQADCYVLFHDLLKHNHLTFEEANQRVKKFKEKFYGLLSKYSISSKNLSATCYDLMEHISKQPYNTDLQYLYFCIITDFGLLSGTNTHDHTEEQEIRNYLHQNELLQELTAFLKLQSDNSRKVLTVMPESFSMILSYEDYGKLDENEIQMYCDAEEKLKEKMLRTAEKFL